LRLPLAHIFYGTLDTTVHLELVNLFYAGKNVYIDGNYAYPPLWLGILTILYPLSSVLQIPFTAIMKYPAILADGVIAVLLYASFAKGGSLKKRVMSALLYALSPIAILVSGYHGQIDSVWIASALLSWFILRYQRYTIRTVFLAALILSFGIALKVFPIVLLPVLLFMCKTWKEKMLYALVAVAPFALSMLVPFITAYGKVVNNFVNYGIELNFWGISYLSHVLFTAFPDNKIFYYFYRVLRSAQLNRIFLYSALLLAYAFFIRYASKLETREMMFLTILVMLITLPFISIQWWIWLVPFALLTGRDYIFFSLYSICLGYVLLVRYYLYLANIPTQYQFLVPVTHPWGIHLDLVNLYIALGVWSMLILWLLVYIWRTLVRK
jgi:uncharacterized membrane protein YkvA (DUF1232 family)